MSTWSVVLHPGASYLHPSGQSPLCITHIHFKVSLCLAPSRPSQTKLITQPSSWLSYPQNASSLRGSGRSVVKVAYDDSDSDESDDWGSSSDACSSEGGIAEVVVAALTPGRIERAQTNFVLSDDVDFVSLSVTGENAVEIVGHYIVDDDEEDDEEEDEDEESGEGHAMDWFEDVREADPYDLLPETPNKYDELFRHLESVIDGGFLAKNPEL